MRIGDTILVDQDGVLARYDKRLMDTVAEEYPTERRFTEEELTLFDTHLHYSEAQQADIDRIALRPGFFEHLEPVEGAVAALQHMLELGFDVRICTAPKRQYQYCVAEKLVWIEKHLGSEFVTRTILTRDKTLVRGVVLIDDKPEIKGVKEPEWEHVLFDRPYNRHILERRRLTWNNYRTVLGLPE